MSDEDYELFLRAVRRRSEDQELADLILNSLPLDSEETHETKSAVQTEDHHLLPIRTAHMESTPLIALGSSDDQIVSDPSLSESSEPDSQISNQIPLRPHRIFIPLKDDSYSSKSGNAATPSALNSSCSADSRDNNTLKRSPRVSIDPNSTGWIDEFLTNFNPVGQPA